MSIPESDLTWQGRYDYSFNSLALFDNDQQDGRPVNVRDLFVQKATDVARVEVQETDVGAA